MFVMVMYNLFIFVAVGERSYLYYLIVVVCMPLLLASLNGFAFQYLWPNATQWNDQAILIFLAGSIIFIPNFLKAHELKGIYRSLGYTLVLAQSVIAELVFFLPYSIVIKILIPFAIAACIYGISFSVYRWNSGGTSVRYFTIAGIALLPANMLWKFRNRPQIHWSGGYRNEPRNWKS